MTVAQPGQTGASRGDADHAPVAPPASSEGPTLQGSASEASADRLAPPAADAVDHLLERVDELEVQQTERRAPSG